MNIRNALLACVCAGHAGMALAQVSAPPAGPPKERTLMAPSSVTGDATAPASTEAQEAPRAWPPGPLLQADTSPPPGRVAAAAFGLAFTLPEAWRGQDVSWRELTVEESKAVAPLAEAALVIDFKPARGEAQRLLTIYRVPIEPWRAADRAGQGGPGRLTMNTSSKGFLVVRGAEPDKPGRYADLRAIVEDVVGTLALYDAYREGTSRKPLGGTDFAGQLIGGGTLALQLAPGGEMTLTMGERKLSGRWLQRETMIIGQLVGAGEGVSPVLVLNFDGSALVVTRWDEKLFGNTGVRLEKAP